MFRSLIVPLDGSANSEQALPLALRVARRANAELDLAIVPATLPLDATREETYLDGVSKQVASASPSRITRSVLNSEAKRPEYPVPACTLVADALVQHSHEMGSDLIVMTTYGRGGLRRGWMGSVADSLVRITPCPVVMIRPGDDRFAIAAIADRGIRHILVPLDGSESAEPALATARAIGELFDARYTLVRVASQLARHGSTGRTAPPIRGDAPSRSREAVQRDLDAVADALRELNVRVATRVLAGTSPADAILKYARTHAADMIAVTTSSAGGTSLMSGHIAAGILRKGDVPVVVCNVPEMIAVGHTVASPASAGAPL